MRTCRAEWPRGPYGALDAIDNPKCMRLEKHKGRHRCTYPNAPAVTWPNKKR